LANTSTSIGGTYDVGPCINYLSPAFRSISLSLNFSFAWINNDSSSSKIYISLTSPPSKTSPGRKKNEVGPLINFFVPKSFVLVDSL